VVSDLLAVLVTITLRAFAVQEMCDGFINNGWPKSFAAAASILTKYRGFGVNA
jgi:hypothetical protein